MPYRSVDGVVYFRCETCSSLFAHPDFLEHIDAGARASMPTTIGPAN